MLPEIVRAAGELGGVEESPLPRPCLAGHRDTSENVIEELSWGGLKLPWLSRSVSSRCRAVRNSLSSKIRGVMGGPHSTFI